MTAEQLRMKFNNEFGLDKEWPQTYEVDAVTYANVCQFMFNKKAKDYGLDKDGGEINIWIGRDCGLLFKGVELIYKVKE